MIGAGSYGSEKSGGKTVITLTDYDVSTLLIPVYRATKTINGTLYYFEFSLVKPSAVNTNIPRSFLAKAIIAGIRIPHFIFGIISKLCYFLPALFAYIYVNGGNASPNSAIAGAIIGMGLLAILFLKWQDKFMVTKPLRKYFNGRFKHKIKHKIEEYDLDLISCGVHYDWYETSDNFALMDLFVFINRSAVAILFSLIVMTIFSGFSF